MGRLFRKRLDLTIVVVAYDMARELPRTLCSLTRDYQRHCAGIDYEVLVVDNGSPEPFGHERVAAYGDNFRYFYLDNPPSSPAYALNYGAERARGRILCLMVDGARLVTPGVLGLAAAAFRAYRDPTVAVLGWHLGEDLQYRSIAAGYDQAREDALLAAIHWPEDGYRLFEIAVLAGSCLDGWFRPIGESNAVFIRRDAYDRLGGFDERFDLPGGGFVNLDFFRRAVLRKGSELIVLLGEGTFHQLHGGIATNTGDERERQNLQHRWEAQYKALRGGAFDAPGKRPVYLGGISPAVLPSLASSVQLAMEALARGDSLFAGSE
ncbi:glycosyltransferase [Candidatus Thiosymbion oneisti]|uniref:glycosyltransferase n=1 Tax=Candidatus Thiosymbion oneisti TaxID=589554 RepID=UPI000A6D0540|nr:glycosyltransferase [Candidatus Thiosymbion oneisti]